MELAQQRGFSNIRECNRPIREDLPMPTARKSPSESIASPGYQLNSHTASVDPESWHLANRQKIYNEVWQLHLTGPPWLYL